MLIFVLILVFYQYSCIKLIMEAIDKIDRQILRILQADGRASFEQIAETVSLSASAILRRVKRLESAGIISQYVALVNPESIGLGLTAFVNVRLEKRFDSKSQQHSPLELFKVSVGLWPEVVECSALTGEMDFLLRLVVTDMKAYSDFMVNTLLIHPSVQDCKTSFVMNQYKSTTAMPV